MLQANISSNSPKIYFLIFIRTFKIMIYKIINFKLFSEDLFVDLHVLYIKH